MEIIGRLTADAKVNELTDGRKVVNFSIAMNESYRVKNSDEIKKATNYFNCSYWISDRIANVLTKGTLVELYGHIGLNTYTSNAGEVKAAFTFHVNNIKLHGKPAKETTGHLTVVRDEADNAKEDLPF
ncbi:MAG TPA: single-stranded DNA-binding protein [Parafilimonas sp.]|nr:single-stranded DNA-binding protein [Parafilimonas sp.]